MSLGDLAMKQANVEDMVAKSLAELRAEVAAAKVPSNDTASKLAAVEQRIAAFERHIIPVLTLMRSQLTTLERTVDRLDMRSRLDCLLFKGIQESTEVPLRQLVEDTLKDKFGLVDPAALILCRRLGSEVAGSNRAILVRFSTSAIRALVWRQRSKLKGCAVSISEFLTKPRQEAFSSARRTYGMRNCWTSDGNIYIKVPEGSKHTVCNILELQDLLKKHPVVAVPGSAPEVSDLREGTKSSARPKRLPKTK